MYSVDEGNVGQKMFWIASSNVFGKQCSPFHCPHHHSTLARLLQHESQHSWTALSLSWLHFLFLWCKLSLHQLQILLLLLINACIILTKYLRSASLWCLNATMVRVFLRDFHAWEISCEISLLSSSQFSSASWCWVVLIFLLDWRLNILLQYDCLVGHVRVYQHDFLIPIDICSNQSTRAMIHLLVCTLPMS